MQTRSRISGRISCVALLLFIVTVQASACTMGRQQFTRNPDIAYFTATATGDTLAVQRTYTTLGYSLNRESTLDTAIAHGHVFEAGSLGGNAAEVARMERAFAKQGNRQVTILFWMFNPACKYSPRPPGWIMKGETLAVTTRLLPENEWANGIPTFDIYYLRWDSYPTPRLRRNSDPIPASGLLSPNQLSPLEFLEVYTHIPTTVNHNRWPIEGKDDAAWEQFDQWLAKWPHVARARPFVDHWRGWSRSLLPATMKKIEADSLQRRTAQLKSS